MTCSAGPDPEVGHTVFRPRVGRQARVAAAAAGAVVLVAWFVAPSDGFELFEHEWLPYLVVCGLASILGGRIAGLTALATSAGAVIFVFFHPTLSSTVSSVWHLAEVLVLFGAGALVITLNDRSLRVQSRALKAEAGQAAASRDAEVAARQARAAEHLRRSEARLRAAFDAQMDPAAVVEAVRGTDGAIIDYRYLFASRALRTAVRHRVEDPRGKLASEVFPETAEQNRAILDRVVTTGQPLALDEAPFYSHQEHGLRRVDVRAAPAGDGVVFSYRDVTDRVESATRLRRSERLYRLLAENTNDAVVVIRDDVIAWASPSSLRAIGWHPEDIVGRPWSDFLDPRDVNMVDALAPPTTPDERVSARARYLSRDGTSHWGEIALVTFLDEEGTPDGIIVSGRNIDDEVAAESEVRELQLQRDRLIEQLPVGVFRARLRADDVLTLDFASARALELFHTSAGAPIDMATVQRVLGSADIRSVRRAAEASVASGQAMVWEGKLTEGAPPVWLRVQGHVDSAGTDLVMDGLVADVTQSKAYEAILAREVEAAAERAALLEERNRTQSALLASLGHDLRTPLAVIASATAALRSCSTLTRAEQLELITNIQLGGEALDHLLTNLLDLRRLESESLLLDLEAVEVLEVLEEPLRHARETVELDLPDDLSCVVADSGLLERALDNLLRNAQRHQPPGMPLSVTAEQAEGRVRLLVTDHGPGVPEERFEEMFLPFHRLDNRSDGGVGLGLFIARAFVLAMGGTLTPSVTPGGGLTMTIELRGCDASSRAR